jgi:hypothetical protein
MCIFTFLILINCYLLAPTRKITTVRREQMSAVNLDQHSCSDHRDLLLSWFKLLIILFYVSWCGVAKCGSRAWLSVFSMICKTAINLSQAELPRQSPEQKIQLVV